MNYEGNEYFQLLKEWCDSLIKLQIHELKAPEFYGGIMCPSCVKVHGRICDAMYPLVYMYSLTKKKKYYTAAQEIFYWTKHNIFRPDGTNVNDPNSMWYGVTVFYNIQLGELLFNHKSDIEASDYVEWFKSYETTTNVIYDRFKDDYRWNVNYCIATAASMAIAWRVFGNEKYYAKAKKFAKISINHITADGLIYGEGHYSNRVTPRGNRPVDLGYNVEESLPNLVLYLRFIDEDKETENAVIRSMNSHLEFMLADGAWDNSWGSRSAKWTYYGSRTSDGCQAAYAYMADKNPKFAEAAHRNFELYRSCSRNGLLTGGPHYIDAEEPACVHHTFCHIKALTALLKSNMKHVEETTLPREEADGIKFFPTADVVLAARGAFRATFSCNDFNIANNSGTLPTGGAATLLYHSKAGSILAASMNEYVLLEDHNMQIPKYYQDICQTPRIELKNEENVYRNTLDTTANITYSDKDGIIEYCAAGVLKDYLLNGTECFAVRYLLSEKSFKIIAKTEAQNACYILPIIAKKNDMLSIDGNTAVLKSNSCIIKVCCSNKIFHDVSKAERIFNPCGGFCTAHLYADLEQNKELVIEVSVN